MSFVRPLQLIEMISKLLISGPGLSSIPLLNKAITISMRVTVLLYKLMVRVNFVKNFANTLVSLPEFLTFRVSLPDPMLSSYSNTPTDDFETLRHEMIRLRQLMQRLIETDPKSNMSMNTNMSMNMNTNGFPDPMTNTNTLGEISHIDAIVKLMKLMERKDVELFKINFLTRNTKTTKYKPPPVIFVNSFVNVKLFKSKLLTRNTSTNTNTNKRKPLQLSVDINDISHVNDFVNDFVDDLNDVNVELLNFKFLTRNTNTNKSKPKPLQLPVDINIDKSDVNE